MLVDAGAELNEQCYDRPVGWTYLTETSKTATPLSIAAGLGCLDILKHLLQSGAGEYDGSLSKALRVSVSRGRLEIVEYLLATEATNLDLASIMLEAVNYPEAMQMLADAGACLDPSPHWTPLTLAVHRRSAKSVKKLIELGANVNKARGNLNTPLAMAAGNGYDEIVDLLVGAGANLIPTGTVIRDAPYMRAKRAGFDNIAKKLCPHFSTIYPVEHTDEAKGIKVGLDSNEGEYSVLHSIIPAVLTDDFLLFEKMIGRVSNVDLEALSNKTCGLQTPLTLAICWQRWKMARRLISAGAEINLLTSNNNGQILATPFHDAVCMGDIEIVKFMLGNGARVDSRDHHGSTPLIRSLSLFWSEPTPAGAACVINGPIVRCLVDAGSDVNVKNKDGQSGLGMAASVGNLEAVSILIEAGADVNQYSTGNTENPPVDRSDMRQPIAWAALNQHEEVVKALLHAGADWVSLKNDPALWYVHRFLMESWFPDQNESLVHPSQSDTTRAQSVKDPLGKSFPSCFPCRSKMSQPYSTLDHTGKSRYGPQLGWKSRNVVGNLRDALKSIFLEIGVTISVLFLLLIRQLLKFRYGPGTDTKTAIALGVFIGVSISTAFMYGTRT